MDPINLHEKNHKSAYRRCKTSVGHPETVLGRREPGSWPLQAAHPEIAAPSAKLLAQHGADDYTNELQADLLCVEAEFRREDLWDLDGGEDAGEVEDDGVGYGWDDDAWVCEQSERGGEVLEGDGVGPDLAKVEVLPLEFGFCAAGGLDAVSNIQSFGGEEEVEDELHAVGYGEYPVYPLPAIGMVGYESHDEGSYWWPGTFSQYERYRENRRRACPRVTMSVQMPIFCPLSLAKNVSVTTALLMAMAGEMKNDTSTLVTI